MNPWPALCQLFVFGVWNKIQYIHPKHKATHFLFVSVDQLFVIPVLQFARSLSSGHGGVEDEELSTTFCCLEGRE